MLAVNLVFKYKKFESNLSSKAFNESILNSFKPIELYKIFLLAGKEFILANKFTNKKLFFTRRT